MDLIPSIQAPKPPYIRFEREAVEVRDVQGKIGFKDVNFAYITQPGGKDTTPKIADEWFDRIKEEARRGTYPAAWYNHFWEMYQLWKKDLTVPLNGTDIKNWPSASPAEIKMLTHLGILTIEDLSTANEEALNAIGMGSRSLKQRAIDFLKAREGAGPLVAELDTMRRENGGLRVEVDQLKSQVRQLLDQSNQAKVGGSAFGTGMFQPPRDLDTRLEEARAHMSDERSDAAAINDSIDEVLG